MSEPAKIGADMAQLAQALVDQITSIAGAQARLDYTEATLPLLDMWVQRIKEHLTKHPAEAQNVYRMSTLQCGAYLGEVVRRGCGGYWDAPQSGGLPQLMSGGIGVTAISASGEFLAGRSVQMPTRAVSTPSEYFAEVVKALRSAFERRLCGDAGTIEALGRAMTDDSSIVQGLTNSLVAALNTAEDRWGLTLDFSPQSVEGVEQILAVMHDGYKGTVARPTDDQIQSMCTIWGVYYGETLRRRNAGKWSVKDRSLLVELKGAMPMTVVPMVKVRKRIVDGPGDNLAHHFNVVEKVLRGELKPS